MLCSVGSSMTYTFNCFLQISQNLYQSYIENVPLFKGCSLEFISQVVSNFFCDCSFAKHSLCVPHITDFGYGYFMQVTRVHEEFFLPGEVIMEQGNVVDQLYFVCHGVLV